MINQKKRKSFDKLIVCQTDKVSHYLVNIEEHLATHISLRSWVIVSIFISSNTYLRLLLADPPVKCQHGRLLPLVEDWRWIEVSVWYVRAAEEEQGAEEESVGVLTVQWRSCGIIKKLRTVLAWKKTTTKHFKSNKATVCWQHTVEMGSLSVQGFHHHGLYRAG